MSEKPKVSAKNLLYQVVAIVLAFSLIAECVLIYFLNEVTVAENEKTKNILSALSSININVLTSSITALLVYLFINTARKRSLYTKLETRSQKKLPVLLENEIKRTKFWYYDGGTGKYTRQHNLPSLAKSAADRKFRIAVVISIINPANSFACKSYIQTSNSRESTRSVQIQLFSTIIASYYYKSITPILDLKVLIKDSHSILRSEINSENLVITKPGDSPFIFAEKESVLYKAYREDFEQNIEHAPNVLVIEDKKISSEITPETVKKLFQELLQMNFAKDCADSVAPLSDSEATSIVTDIQKGIKEAKLS